MEENQNSEYDDSFWEEVDALRAMLDEEDGEEALSMPQWESVPEQRASAFPAAEQPDFRRESLSRGPSHKRGPSDRRVPSRKRSSAGLLVCLYVIIVLELAAIGGIGASWYLWLQ